MATRQPKLELPCLTDSKESQEIVLFEGMWESKPTYRGRHHDILYQNTPTSRICVLSVRRFVEVPIQNRCLDIIGIPRTSLPTLEDR